MGVYWERDGEPGELVECPVCGGWDDVETGLTECAYCNGEGNVWRPLLDEEGEQNEPGT